MMKLTYKQKRNYMCYFVAFCLIIIMCLGLNDLQKDYKPQNTSAWQIPQPIDE